MKTVFQSFISIVRVPQLQFKVNKAQKQGILLKRYGLNFSIGIIQECEIIVQKENISSFQLYWVH